MSTEIATQQTGAVAPYLPVLTPDELQEMRESMESFDNLQLPIIRGMKDGEFVFSEGEEPLKEFTGTILYTKKTNVYYEGRYKVGEKNPPRCFSPDGVTPISDNPIHATCEGCPMNQYPKDKEGNVTGPKPCKNTRPLFILAQGSVMPRILRTPPSSLKLVQSYCTGVLANGTSYKGVKTNFSFFKEDQAQTHWQLKLRTVGRLNGEEKNVVKQIEALWSSTMSKIDPGLDEDIEEPSNESKPTEEPSREF